MASRLQDEVGPNGQRSAERRFPSRSDEIRNLISADESFREMCDDLSFAEEALAATDRLSESVRERRRAEYAALVEALAKEIENTLCEAKVISISKAPKR